MSLTSTVLLANPVVDIDGTFFVQGGLFLLMVFLLNGLLFKPWLEVQERRKNSIGGALEKAEQLTAKAQSSGEEYDAKLRGAREEAQVLRSAARKDGEGEMAVELGKARDAARVSVEAAREKTNADAAEARTALGARVDELAKDISSKILGRTG